MPGGPSKTLFNIIKMVNNSHTHKQIERKWMRQGERYHLLFFLNFFLFSKNHDNTKDSTSKRMKCKKMANDSKLQTLIKWTTILWSQSFSFWIQSLKSSSNQQNVTISSTWNTKMNFTIHKMNIFTLCEEKVLIWMLLCTKIKILPIKYGWIEFFFLNV